MISDTRTPSNREPSDRGSRSSQNGKMFFSNQEEKKLSRQFCSPTQQLQAHPNDTSIRVKLIELCDLEVELPESAQ